MIPFQQIRFVYCFLFFVSLPFAARSFATADDGVVRILAIGNSFSADAIENSLFDLAKEKGIKTVVANLYIGGAPLTLHVKNADGDVAAYSYRKTAVDGSRTTTANISIATALADEEWDYVSFQQASPLSGQLNTIEASLPALFEYVKRHSKNPEQKYIFHQTWAYSQHSIQAGFANYGNDQKQMYDAIVNVSKEVTKVAPIDIVVPAGTAIQNARTSYIGDNLDRDGYHLRLPLGRYVAACTWFEKIFKINVVGMRYKPAELTDLEREVAQHAAHQAVLKPFEVTPLKRFKKGPRAIRNLAAAVLVDFGGSSHEGCWNPVMLPSAGKTYSLKDSLNRLTQVELEMLERFNGKNTNGTNASATPFQFPKDVTTTSYFGNSKPMPNSAAYPRARFRLSGLDKKKVYDLSFFASRMGDSLGIQETQIVCLGSNSQEGTLNVTDNVSGTVDLKRTKPAADGSLTITVTVGPGNTSEHGLYYLSALRLSESKN